MSKTLPRQGLFWRRALFLFPVLALTAEATWLAHQMMDGGAFNVLDAAILLVFALNFLWISMSGWTVVLGFGTRVADGIYGLLAPGRPRTLDLQADGLRVHEAERTARAALIMPIYNEDPDRVIAGLEVMAHSLKRHAGGEAIDIFILSDTRNAEIAAHEEAAWRELVANSPEEQRIYYRRRTENHGRKAGNVADFCEKWGSDYRYMIVLDADSVMDGGTMLKMVDLMEANPKVGMIQTVPMPAGRETLFARLNQFACRLYAPLSVRGLDFWAQRDANYWGHNAIIRVDAFVQHCGLPVLPGREPLGGEILCHDVVEAALIRRAGWEVWVLPDMGGSFEEIPANVVDFAKRDKRWCQGNLQHMKLLGAQGLRQASRWHLLVGIMTYVSSPLWLAFLALTTAQMAAGALGLDDATGAQALVRSGYGADDSAGPILFWMTIGVLFLPKLLSLAEVLVSARRRRLYGGALPLLASALLEQLYCMLIAPVMMLFHSQFVVEVLLGHTVGWDSQERTDRGVGWREAMRRHWTHTLFGAVFGTVTLAVAPVSVFWWSTPMLAGFLLSGPMTVLTSRLTLGRLALKAGLFLTPDEVAPESVLVDLQSVLDRSPAATPAFPARLPHELPAVREVTPMRPQPLRGQGIASGLQAEAASS